MRVTQRSLSCRFPERKVALRSLLSSSRESFLLAVLWIYLLGSRVKKTVPPCTPDHMNLGGRGRRHSTRNLLLYGFVLLSIAFFVFVFLNMPVSGDIPRAFGDMQTHFVSTKSIQTFSKKDRPARFRSQHNRLSVR